MQQQPSDFDSPWKEALERFFPTFMALFFPQAYADIDWSRGYEFLDTELQQVVRDAELGRRLADKLIKVWRKDGEEAWVLIHIEVQGQPERDFQKRMYVYNFRFFDRYDRPVVSLAVLGDENPSWCPDHYEYSLWGCRAGLWFPVVKLLDYRASERRRELEESENIFAIIVLSYLDALASRDNSEKRYNLKMSLARNLLRKGLTEQDIIEALRVIDWMMRMPPELENRFDTEIHAWEEDEKMALVAHFEQTAIDRGLQQGLQQGVLQATREDILDVLTARFVTVPEGIAAQVQDISDLTVLKALVRKASTVGSLEEFQDCLG